MDKNANPPITIGKITQLTQKPGPKKKDPDWIKGTIDPPVKK